MKWVQEGVGWPRFHELLTLSGSRGRLEVRSGLGQCVIRFSFFIQCLSKGATTKTRSNLTQAPFRN